MLGTHHVIFSLRSDICHKRLCEILKFKGQSSKIEVCFPFHEFLGEAPLELVNEDLISKLWSFVRCDFQWDSRVTERWET